MEEPRKIGCTTHAGTHGKKEQRSELKVEHKRLGAVITLYRQVGIGDPIEILLSLPEAAQLVADLSRAVEIETVRRIDEDPGTAGASPENS